VRRGRDCRSASASSSVTAGLACRSTPGRSPARWDEPHAFDVAVALVGDDGAVTTYCERFAFWPFTADDLRDDLRSVGLEPAAASVQADTAARYLVTARHSA
jgi:hypothetical protein